MSDWSSDVCSSVLARSLPWLLGKVWLPATMRHGNWRKSFSMQLAKPLRKSPLRTARRAREIGRASRSERVCQSVWLSVDAVTLRLNTNLALRIVGADTTTIKKPRKKQTKEQ